MASSPPSFAVWVSAIVVILCCFSGQTRGGGGSLEVVSLESLMPAAVCSSPKARVNNSLTVVHRHGPCSSRSADQSKIGPLEILRQDEERVASLKERLDAASRAVGLSSADQSIKAARLDVQVSGSYVVEIGLGTPTQVQTVAMDTGSDVCWVQCKPCAGSCYDQQEPIFDPSASSSYRNVSCSSKTCGKLNRGNRGCSSGTCVYVSIYADNSTTAGFLATEKLQLTATDAFADFAFGCGQQNKGLFGGNAGLFGLGRGSFSLVSQTSSTYGNVFSYCLPRTRSSTGHLSLGNSSLPPSVGYTPMLTDRRDPGLYFIDLIGISVGGSRLPINSTVFRKAGTIIDSGTTITRLPPSAYASLRQAFRSAMSSYRLSTQPSKLLDTCYDFTNVQSKIVYPVIVLHYTGLDVPLPEAGTFYASNISRVCLAFASDADLGVIGNVQQRTFEVVYDIGAKRIGFADKAC